MPNFSHDQLKTYHSYAQDPLSQAIKNFQLEEVEKHLKNLPNINEPEGGIFALSEDFAMDKYTYLMQACGVGDVQIVKALLDAGAAIDWQNEQGTTALCVAISNNQVDIFGMLIQQKAKVLLPGVSPCESWKSLKEDNPTAAKLFETEMTKHCTTYQEHKWLYAYLNKEYPEHKLCPYLRDNLAVFKEQQFLSLLLPVLGEKKKAKLKI